MIARLAEAAHRFITVALTRSLQSLPNLGVSSLDLGRSPRRTAFLYELLQNRRPAADHPPRCFMLRVLGCPALQKMQLSLLRRTYILCNATLRACSRRALLGRFLPRLGPFVHRTALFSLGSGGSPRREKPIRQRRGAQTTTVPSGKDAPPAHTCQLQVRQIQLFA